LQHEGAERSAHETIEAEQQAWSSIAHLADQYETVAQEAQAEHITELFARASPDHGLVDEADRVGNVPGPSSPRCAGRGRRAPTGTADRPRTEGQAAH
jgi:hypothetical protein